MQPTTLVNNGKFACNPKGWFASEKLDGMKARWIDGQLITRSGQTLPATEEFLSQLPNFDVEGELYLGQGKFHDTATLRIPKHPLWNSIDFYIFDVVDYKKSWKERQEKLKKKIVETEQIHILQWHEINSLSHLKKCFERVCKNNGEGVVIIDPNSMYKDGHVDCMYKWKKLCDAEAKIIGYKVDDDKRLASLLVDNGTKKFNIGTGIKQKERYTYEKCFPIGAYVSYTYELLSSTGKPRTPVLKGIRFDHKQ